MSAEARAPRGPLSYYGWSLGIALAAVAAAGALWGVQAAFLVAVLSVLEISLSLDNAVVNAKILEHWDERWRRIFLTWGILVAVFGMRLVFPIVIVCVATGLGPVDVTQMALYREAEYAAHMQDAHYQIAGFGGAFLLMVALGFFFADKHVHWLEWAETKLTKFGQIEGISAAVTIAALFLARAYVPAERQSEFFVAGVLGMAVFIAAHGLGTLVSGEEDDDAPESAPGKQIVRGGVAGFLYIELLDASFSFDGVIGAFVLTTYLPIIMLGLGVGAFFVRSFTVHLVETGKLAEFRYLEHGAFYAILVLAAIMLAPGLHLPEWVVGLSGAVILGVALLHSHLHNKAARKNPMLLTDEQLIDELAS